MATPIFVTYAPRPRLWKPSYARYRPRRGVVADKSFRISPDQRSGSSVPQSTLFTFEGLSPALTEKRPSNRSARQTNNVAQFCFRWPEDPFQAFRNKKIPATQKCLS